MRLYKKLTKYLFPIILAISIFCLNGCKQNVENDFKETYTCNTCPKIESDEDTLEFAKRVMIFLDENANYGFLPNTLIDTFYKLTFETFPVDTFLSIFRENMGVTTCGLSSSLMVKILDSNDIKAYTYNFGISNSEINHVITLVYTKGKYYVFDPYQNCYYFSKSLNSHTDIFNLMDSISMGKKPSKICFESKADFILTDMKTDTSITKLEDACLTWLYRFTNEKKFNICKACGAFTPCYNMEDVFANAYKDRFDNSFFEIAFLDKINKIWGSEDSEKLDSLVEAHISILKQKKYTNE
jgi:hypothetical protein